MKVIGPTTTAELLRLWGRRLDSLETSLGTLARDKTYPSDQRPDPVGRPGARIFDIGLGKPLWSNGTAWVDATGTAV